MQRRSTRIVLTLLGAVALSSTIAVAEEPIPEPNLEALEPGVRERMQTAREALVSALASPDLEGSERGRLYGETGKVFHAHHAFEVAAACYRNASELDPEDWQWSYLVGFLYQDAGRYDKARSEYEKVLANEPGHAFAELRLAQVYLDLNQLDDAAPLLEKAVEDERLAATAHEALGKLAGSRGDHEASARHYEAALELQPEATRLHVPLGLAYRGLGDLDKAREHLAHRGQGKVRLNDPALLEIGSLTVSSEMFISTATQAIKAGRFDDAEQAYRGAIAVNPENPRPHVNLAELLARRGAFEEAEASGREALRLDPDSFFARFNLGHVFELQGRLEDAARFFKEAIEKDPGSVKANYRYAGVLMKKGDYAAATEFYAKAAELAPALSHARYLQALAELSLERYDEALRVLETALEVSPDNADIKGALARLLATLLPNEESPRRALEIARELFESRRTTEDLETLAMALAASGRFDEAVQSQLAVIEAARSAGDSEAVETLEYNLARYRARLPSDRPWPKLQPTQE